MLPVGHFGKTEIPPAQSCWGSAPQSRRSQIFLLENAALQLQIISISKEKCNVPKTSGKRRHQPQSQNYRPLLRGRIRPAQLHLRSAGHHLLPISATISTHKTNRAPHHQHNLQQRCSPATHRADGQNRLQSQSDRS